MRRFKLLAEILLLVLTLLSLSQLRQQLSQNYEAPPVCNGDSIKTLILGDSHARAAINPDYLSSACSAAQKAEEIEYSYYKLVHAVAEPNALENVILCASYFNFLAPVDSESEMLKRYHRLLDEEYYLAKKRHHEYTNAHTYRYLMDHKLPKAVPISLLNEIIENNIAPLYLGAFELRTGSRIGQIQDLHKAIQRHYYQGNRLRETSELRITYFEKIVELCKTQELRLYVINTPLHKKYYNLIPAELIKGYDAVLNRHQDGCIRLDYGRLGLPDSFFFDYDHLNGEGARLFTQIIRQDLSQEATNSRSSRFDYSKPVAHNLSHEGEVNGDETP